MSSSSCPHPDSARFLNNPVEFFDCSPRLMHSGGQQRLEALQLAALRMRFTHLRDRIPVLTMMSDEQNIHELTDLDDVVALLFRHTMYKSYPSALLLDGRFDQLTRWLDRLTAVDLRRVDTTECDSIDAWLDVLDANTDLRVVHTSGTTGAMSFLPHTVHDFDKLFQGLRCDVFAPVSPGCGGEEEYCDVLWPTYRYGRSGMTRCAEFVIRHLAGGSERFHVMMDAPVSADAVFYASRMATAQARGERFEASPVILRRHEEFQATQRELIATLPRFVEQCAELLAAKRVFSIGLWSAYYEMATAGRSRGLRDCFAPSSSIWPGGGAKGTGVPDDWEDSVRRFFGVPELQHMYAMSEVMAFHRLCPSARYHIQPWVVLYVLDPDTGEILPRHGTRTGRAAFFDLLPDTYWGGFISGDEVSVQWSPCSCGRTTPSLGKTIRRYSDLRKADDKVTCVASEQAHRNALDLLAGTGPTGHVPPPGHEGAR
ncbi:MAG: hypothetical protein ACRDTG_17875 [Pseudonocardiaceae bacterium]